MYVLMSQCCGFDQIESGELWTELVYSDDQRFVLTATTPGVDTASASEEKTSTVSSTGLVPGHAYTLVTCVEVNGVRLCRLRNPWGSMEWTGDWSDHSDCWTPEMTTALTAALAAAEEALNDPDADKSTAATEKKDDGLFWMSFEDFTQHFNSVSICYVRHKAYCATPWSVERRKFFFDYDKVKSQDSTQLLHQVRNPLYRLSVAEEGEFCCTVHQVDTRCEGSKAYIDVGVAVVQADPTKVSARALCILLLLSLLLLFVCLFVCCSFISPFFIFDVI
jgi:hypothetical protein